MRFSKRDSQLMLISLSLVMAACSLPKPQKREMDESASFYLDRADAPKFVSTEKAERFSIPISKTLSLKACFKSNQKSRTVMNHTFEISGGASTFKTTSDENGCIKWDEKIAYNALADAHYILIERHAKAIGYEKGSRTLQWIISPWSDYAASLTEVSASAMNYLKGDEATKALAGKNSSALQVTAVDVSSQELQGSATGTALNLQIETPLQIERLSESGVKILETLSDGQFEVEVSLIKLTTENQKEVRTLMGKAKSNGVISLQNGKLMFQTPIQLGNADQICAPGQIGLGLSLIPNGAPTGLRGYEGFFPIGDCTKLNSHFGSVQQKDLAERFLKDPQFTVQKYVTEPPVTIAPQLQSLPVGPNAKTTPPATVPYQAPRTQFSQIEFHDVGFKGQRTVDREREFDSKICLKMGLDQRAVRGQKFDITKLNGETISVTSQEDGCLNWRDSLKFNIYASECWSSRAVQIRNSDLGVNETVKISVNPWSTKEIFAKDARFTDNTKDQCSTGASELLTSHYDFDKLSFGYSIDEALNLEVKKRGNLRLALKLKRPSFTEASGFSEEPVPNGPYLLRIAIVDMGITDYSKANGHILMTREMIANVRGNSTIAEEVEFSAKDLRAMGNTSQILFEILPLRIDAAIQVEKNPGTPLETLIDPKMQIIPITFRGSIILANNNSGENLVPIDDSGHSIIAGLVRQFHADQAANNARLQRAVSTPQYAKEHNLIFLSLDQENQSLGFRNALANPLQFRVRENFFKPTVAPPFTTEAIRKMIDQGLDDQTRLRLCQYWFYDFWRRPLPIKGASVLSPTNNLTDNGLARKCHMRLNENQQSVFDVETKYFPKNAKAVGVQDGSFFRDLTINRSFSLAHSYTTSKNQSWSYSLGVGLRFRIPGIDWIGASAGADYHVSTGTSDAQSQDNSVSYGAGVTVQVETLKLKIVAPEYEKCLVIKLNPNIFTPTENSRGMQPVFDEKLSDDEKAYYMQTGYMICDSPRHEKFETVESYYILNQPRFGAQIMDVGASSSRAFFMALRGQSDFVRFMSYLHESEELPKSFEPEFQRALIAKDPLPAVFMRGFPTSPGVITAP